MKFLKQKQFQLSWMASKFIKSIKVYLPKLKNPQMKSYILIFFSLILFSSCLNDNDSNFTPQTEADIIKYIEDNDLNANRTSSGLYYVINNEGTGARPTSSSNVTVAYKGYFLDGNTFDQSDDNGISFGLNQVIRGWTEGIQLFKKGEMEF